MKNDEAKTIILREKVVVLKQLLERMHAMQNKLRWLTSKFQLMKDKREAENDLPF